CHSICAIQFNFSGLISSCGGANLVSYAMQSFEYLCSIWLYGRVWAHTACLGKVFRHLADETRTDILHLLVSRDLFREVWLAGLVSYL
ncbi:hypothetical protein N7517_004822, partial [Penicillium concentricum]